MTVAMDVRPAVLDDAPEIFRLLLDLNEELPMFRVEPFKALKRIRSVIQNGFVVVVVATDAEGKSELAGSIALEVDEWWFNEEAFLVDLWVFVRRKYRPSRAALMMVRMVKGLARDTGLPLVLGIFTTEDLARKHKLYRRHFTQMGYVFTYGLKDRASARQRARANGHAEPLAAAAPAN